MIKQHALPFLFVLFFSLLLFPSAARAAEQEDSQRKATRILIGATSTMAVVPTYDGSIVLAPVGVEIGAHPRREIDLVAFFEYGESTSLGCSECGGWRARGGARARVHLARESFVDPWLGGAIAYERLHVPGRAVNPTTFGGIDVPSIEIGLDLHPIERLHFGPRAGAELVWRGPEAPAWSVGQSQWPIQYEAGLRLALDL